MRNTELEQLTLAVDTLATITEGLKDLTLEIISASDMKLDISLEEIDETLNGLFGLVKRITSSIVPEVEEDEPPELELLPGGKAG